MKTPLVGGGAANNPSNSATNYTYLNGGNNAYSATDIRQQLFACSGTLKNLAVQVTTAPGAGKSWTVTVMIDSVATSIVAVIDEANTTATDLVNTAAFSAGQTVSLRIVPSGTPTASRMRFGAIADCAANVCPLIAGTLDTTDLTTTEYLGPIGISSNFQANYSQRSQIFSPAGTLKNLYIKLSVAPGVGATQTFTVYQNGSATLMVVVITGTNLTGNDLGHPLTIAAGDTIAIENSHLVNPAISDLAWGFEFNPTVDGESPMAFNSESSADDTNVTYQHTQGAGLSWSTTEADRQVLAPLAFLVKNMYVALVNAPGAGNSRAFMLRDTAADASVTVTISGTNTTGSDLVNTYNFALYDRFCYRNTPASTPTSSGSTGIGVTAYIVPDVVGSTYPGYIGGGYF